MQGLHLKKRGNCWHYQRRVPKRFQSSVGSGLISFSLQTRDFSEAKLKAAQVSIDLDKKWVRTGTPLNIPNKIIEFTKACQVQHDYGFTPKSLEAIADNELLQRLRTLLEYGHPVKSQKALLGLADKPQLSLSEAFERFWEHIKEEWMIQSEDQKRAKRNVYLKAIRNFEQMVGKIPVYEVERSHALLFRAWFIERVNRSEIKPYTGNREINSLRRLFSETFDIDGETKPNPFVKVRLKEGVEVSRQPLSTKQISTILTPGAMDGLFEEFQLLVRLLVNTGMRPVEAIGLELSDVFLNENIPHIHVRRNQVRNLKTDHSERLLPLTGVSMAAAQELVLRGGWGKRLGKNMYATSAINKHLRARGYFSDKKQSLYSLRHWFQDQLTKRGCR